MTARTPSLLRRSPRSDRGVSRGKVECFDCGGWTGSPVEVFRRSDGKPINWGSDSRRGDYIFDCTDSMVGTIFFVHRAGTGCNKGRTPDAVRTAPKEA